MAKFWGMCGMPVRSISAVGGPFGQRGSVLVLLALCLAACQAQENSPSQSVEKPQEKKDARVSCARVGPLSCDVLPLEDLVTGACPRLRDSLEGRQIGDQIIRHVVDCDAPVLSADSGLGRAAGVATQLDMDGPPSHGAYLFVKSKNGWCPADQLLEPTWNHGGYCEAQFKLRWEGSSTEAKALLYVDSERICHMPLGQQEIAAGESDVAMSECRHAKYEYEMAKNVLTKLSESELEGSCQAM